jgi:hypothetical protein
MWTIHHGDYLQSAAFLILNQHQMETIFMVTLISCVSLHSSSSHTAPGSSTPNPSLESLVQLYSCSCINRKEWSRCLHPMSWHILPNLHHVENHLGVCATLCDAMRTSAKCLELLNLSSERSLEFSLSLEQEKSSSEFRSLRKQKSK